MGAKLGPSWSQVGLYKGSKSHLKVTSKLSLFFIEFIEFWTPKRVRSGMGNAISGVMGKLHFGSKNRACVPAMKKSPKGDFLHNNHHDSVI